MVSFQSIPLHCARSRASSSFCLSGGGHFQSDSLKNLLQEFVSLSTPLPQTRSSHCHDDVSVSTSSLFWFSSSFLSCVSSCNHIIIEQQHYERLLRSALFPGETTHSFSTSGLLQILLIFSVKQELGMWAGLAARGLLAWTPGPPLLHAK